MIFSNLALPLLALSTAVEVSLAKAVHGRRSTHPSRDFGLIRRSGNSHVAIAEARSVSEHKPKGKRLVKKKKKRSTCKAAASSNTTLISTASSVTATSSVIGDTNWASISSASVVTSVSATSIAATSVTAAATSSSSSSSSSSTSDWTLVETVSGSNFFDFWTFWDYDDPTHGTVDYVDSATAWSEGLISINSAGNAIMTVDTTETISGGRKAVRIHSNKTWTGGMVLMDAVHMPTGCGTWPAWWQNGPNWPVGGEIDILETINEFTENQISLHTDNGCTMPQSSASNQTGTYTTGDYDSYNCASYATSNQGCGVRMDDDDTSSGSGYNSIGGGVYALRWDKTGIAVWWFPRGSIPSDITNDQPDPSGWGTPAANFPADTCDPYTYFYDNFNIFTNTFCGDWAGADGVWNYAGYAGQSQSCAALTGYSTCSEYVQNVGSAFSEAYWEVSYVKYFNSTSQV